MGENMDKALKDRLTEIENILKSGISDIDEFQEINCELIRYLANNPDIETLKLIKKLDKRMGKILCEAEKQLKAGRKHLLFSKGRNEKGR
jgi:hypothetical protein